MTTYDTDLFTLFVSLSQQKTRIVPVHFLSFFFSFVCVCVLCPLIASHPIFVFINRSLNAAVHFIPAYRAEQHERLPTSLSLSLRHLPVEIVCVVKVG